MDMEKLVLKKIEAAFPDAIEETAVFRGEQTLFIKKERITAVCQLLKDHKQLQYNFLSDICADDMLPDFPRFAVNYHLYSIPNKHRLRLRVRVEDPDEGPKTLSSLWGIASWLETEVWDLMGIRFDGNKSLRRLFLPEDWQGHPLQKDYPLGYEEVQFSFNFKEIDAKKPYAKE
ncbi:MAG: NADH-quinone oxidoreductase subunit C [Chloroflexi bacterium]|nr:NADH-quinone oxidoreductase subunit C [Chloroflexota bacterium]